MDISPETDHNAASPFLSNIAIIRLMVELGRTNIITKFSLLSLHLAFLREECLEPTANKMS